MTRAERNAILERVWAVFGDDVSRWTQESRARDAGGRKPNYIAGVWSDDLATALGFESVADMMRWNDAPGRTFAEVRARFRARMEAV